MYKINNLNFKYDKSDYALEDINMDLGNGDVIGVVGSNGSGKSTLFMNMMGILKPSSGEIIFDEDVIKYDKKSLYNLRTNVGIVFQDPEKQIFHSRVYDDIAFALRNIGIDEDEIKRRVKKSLEEVRCLDLIEKPIHFLSYGQKKRIAIASIIAMQNKVVLLDEPTSGLDPSSTKAVIDIINRMKKNRVKVVITSHDMDLIYNICDYIYVLNKGSLVIEGGSTEVFEDEKKILESNLDLPWLVKVHKHMNLPLFKCEEDLFSYYKNSHNQNENTDDIKR